MYDVFISYSTKDKKTADRLVKFLEDSGLRCWIAPRDISPGSDWASSISSAINSSRIFLLVYSANSAASDQCAREIAIADTKKGMLIVPYKTDDTELTGSYEYYLGGAQWVVADCDNGIYNYEGLIDLINNNGRKTTGSINPVKSATDIACIVLSAILIVIYLILFVFIGGFGFLDLLCLIPPAAALYYSIKRKKLLVRIMGIVNAVLFSIIIAGVFINISNGVFTEADCVGVNYILCTEVLLSVILIIVTFIKRKPAVKAVNISQQKDIPREEAIYQEQKSMISEVRPIVISCSEQHSGGKVHIRRNSNIKIGRDGSQCSIVYRDGTSGVSGIHCSVSYDFNKNVFIVTDLGSTYGTYVMPAAKKLEKGKQYEFAKGTSLCIGDPANVIKLDME